MAERPRVLVTSWLVQEDDSALEVLRAAGCEVVMARTPRPRTAEQMIEALADVDGVIAGSDNYQGPAFSPYSVGEQEASSALRRVVHLVAA